MKFDKLIQASFVKRLNRFTVVCQLQNQSQQVLAHLANTGRLQELLITGATVFLKPVKSTTRKTAFDLVLASKNNKLVALDSQLGGKLFAEAIASDSITELQGYRILKKEYTFNKSRLDFLLAKGEEQALIEVKSVNLVENKVALFPDAPTKRGTRHVKELIKAQLNNLKAVLFFVIQREDATVFSPHQKRDQTFADLVFQAHQNNVQVLAYTCYVSQEKMCLQQRIPVKY